MALLVAVIEEMVLRKDACPMLLVSTHFHDMMTQKMLPSTKRISYHQMQSIINGDEMICLHVDPPLISASSSFVCLKSLERTLWCWFSARLIRERWSTHAHQHLLESIASYLCRLMLTCALMMTHHVLQVPARTVSRSSN